MLSESVSGFRCIANSSAEAEKVRPADGLFISNEGNRYRTMELTFESRSQLTAYQQSIER